jgi:Ca-activated chloride channel family protein
MEVNYVHVNTGITNQIAVTSIEQEFYNPNPSRLEGTFVFPVPKGAHLDKFAMEIDGKQVEAELLGADKARKMYEEIVRKLKDPALLEYSDRDIFKVRVFPIEPNSKKRITLRYTELLKTDNGLANYSLPLDTERFSARPIKNVSVKVDLETKRPLKSIYSPSHAVEVKRQDANHAIAGYEASDVQPDADFALYFAPEKEEIGVNLLTARSSGEDGYFLLLASPGVDVREQQIVLKDVVFVLDTSGSMAGKKLEQAKKALAFCVENLNDGDRFEILRFSTEVESLFDKFVKASKPNRAKAQDFIKDLKAMGGTAIDDALRKALDLRSGAYDQDRAGAAERPLVVIFLTDGCPTVGATDQEAILATVKKHGAGRTRIFCFGIGTDVNTHLLDSVAQESRAVSQYVLPEEDLEVKVSNFYAKIKEPVLANPTLQFTGGVHATKLYPSPLPDLFKGEQLVLVGRYSGRGDSAVIIEGTVNGQTRKFTFEVKFPTESSNNAFIPRLWATRRVGYLLDEIRLRGDNPELSEEVTELARKYGIVTPYTAYLILEDETRRGVPLTMQSFRRLSEDKAAYSVAGEAFESLKRAKSGDAAVVNAMSGLALREAENAVGNVSMAREQNRFFLRRFGLNAGTGLDSVTVGRSALAETSAAERVTQYAQQQRFVSGRNFFQNDKKWVDSSVQTKASARRVRIQFGSPEYFEFAGKNATARPWLALGRNVEFVLDNVVYEIYE